MPYLPEKMMGFELSEVTHWLTTSILGIIILGALGSIFAVIIINTAKKSVGLLLKGALNFIKANLWLGRKLDRGMTLFLMPEIWVLREYDTNNEFAAAILFVILKSFKVILYISLLTFSYFSYFQWAISHRNERGSEFWLLYIAAFMLSNILVKDCYVLMRAYQIFVVKPIRNMKTSLRFADYLRMLDARRRTKNKGPDLSSAE